VGQANRSLYRAFSFFTGKAGGAITVKINSKTNF
jgi:hypothetical protein